MSDLVVAVDGGGSKTVAVVVDREGIEWGRANAGSSNFTVVGTEQAGSAVREAVIEAVRVAGGELPVRVVWAGLSGIDRPDARESLLPLLQPLAGEIRLTNDAELIFGALDDGIGVVLIAGTGSIALGRDPSGATARAGGWGHLMGDEGSGYDLGRRALQAAARAADGRGPATALLDLILHHWQLAQPLDMIGRAHRSTEKAAMAELSSVMFAAAEAGDQVARGILADAASELAIAVVAAAEHLTLPHRDLPLAVTGGLLVGNEDYRQAVLRRIRRRRSLGQVSVVDDPALSAAQSMIGAR